MNLDIAFDFFPLCAAILAALTCGLLGNFLVLRQQSLMGDAISHAVLPGLVLGFVISSSLASLTILICAAIAGVIAVIAIELIKQFGRVEPGAAMGVVFSVMFALGVLFLEIFADGNVHVDADSVLYGQLETLTWFDAPMHWHELSLASIFAAMPRAVSTLAIMFLVSVLFVGLLFKELRITSFDPSMAQSQGISAQFMHLALMIVVAAATVASFEAVGSILVIGMLIAPAATARLLTDRLWSQMWVSLVVAVLTAVSGYMAATIGPRWIDPQAQSVNAAGAMTVMAGVWLMLAMVCGPRYGLIRHAFNRISRSRTQQKPVKPI